ncbi:hypothetical protein [Halocola ammonii]
MNDFTLDDLASFSREEDSFYQIFKNKDMVEMPEVELEPSDDALNRIFAYNKAVSVRESEKMDRINMVLN